MKTLILVMTAFASSLAVGAWQAPRPASAAAPKACVYCRGDRCGRGTLGAYWCSMDQWGCSESGECDRS